MGYLNFGLKKVFKTSLLLMMVFFTALMSVGCDSFEKLENDVDYYNKFIIPTYQMGSYDYFPSSMISPIKNGNSTLVSFENSETKSGFIVGYVNKDLYDFISLVKESNPNYFKAISSFSYFSYENAIMGEYISYIYRHYLDEIKSNDDVFVEYKLKDRTINTKINNDLIRWYKFKNLKDILEVVDEDYYIDVIMTPYEYTIKKDILSNQDLNFKDTYLYPKMYRFIDRKLEKVIPDEKDYIWNQLQADITGEYITRINKNYNEDAFKTISILVNERVKQYGPFKILNKDNKRYLDYNADDENYIFDEYTVHSYAIEKFIDNKYYYDYDKFVQLINDILDKKMAPYRSRTKRWPSQDFFDKYRIDYFENPSSTIVLSSKDNQIRMDKCIEADLNTYAKKMFDQGYNLNYKGERSEFDQLFYKTPSKKFTAYKSHNGQMFEVNISFYSDSIDNIINIEFNVK